MGIQRDRHLFYPMVGCVLALLIFGCKVQPTVRLSEQSSDRAQALLEEINDLNRRSHYMEAIPKAQHLIELVEKRKGPDHPGTASCMNILGGLYISSGDYEKAVPMLKQAARILRNAGQEQSEMLAATLGMLAKAQLNLGQTTEAEKSAKESLALREITQGENSLGTSTALNTLAEIHIAMGSYLIAENELLRAIDIRARRNNIHGLIVSLNSLSSLYCLTNEFRKAEPLALEVLQLGQTGLGTDHLHVGVSLNILGQIYAATGREGKALESMREAQRIDLSAIDTIKGVSSERQKLAFVAQTQRNYHKYLSLISRVAPKQAHAATYGMNAVLQRKGIILDVQKTFQQALTRGDDEALRVLSELNEVRGALSQLAFSDAEVADIDSFQARQKALQKKKEQLEFQLANLSLSFKRSTEQARANTDSIARALPAGSALVEVVNIHDTGYSGTEDLNENGPRYLAFVLLPGHPRSVRMVNLGDAGPIDDAIATVHSKLPYSDPATSGPNKALRILHDKVFSPIERELGNAKHIYLSLDGALNLLPFEILPNEDGRYLVQDYEMTYLNSGRDLLGSTEKRAPATYALLMGDPNFDLALSRSMGRASDRRSVDLSAIHFSPLPETRREIITIADMIGPKKVRFYLGAQATEDNLFAAKSPKYLHLATHGFFLSNQEFKALTAKDRRLRIQGLQRIENPLIRSGIALAGANTSLKTGNSSVGIVTAEKILGMDLGGTELVVLSACETGVGEVNSGEGVFGLQRSLAQAGTRGLLMSMWPVQDRETKELMIHFYRNLLVEHETPSKALRKAMLSGMEVARQRYGQANPALWGAFVYKQCTPTQ